MSTRFAVHPAAAFAPRRLSIPIGVVVLMLIVSAGAQSPGALAGYALGAGDGDRHELPRDLAEISGLAVSAAGHVFAHADERGVVYQLDPALGRVVKSFTLGERPVRGDFEGIAIAGDRFFMTTADGTIVEFREGADGAAVAFTEHATELGRQCEIEGLEYDAATRALLLPCKMPRRDLRGRLVVFSWSVDNRSLEPAPRYSIPLDFLEQRGMKRNLHPASIAIHPRAGTLFLIAAQEKLIVEFTRDGRVLDVRELEGRHPQAEGIAFLADGRMLIADERSSGGVLTVYGPTNAAPTKEPS